MNQLHNFPKGKIKKNKHFYGWIFVAILIIFLGIETVVTQEFSIKESPPITKSVLSLVPPSQNTLPRIFPETVSFSQPLDRKSGMIDKMLLDWGADTWKGGYYFLWSLFITFWNSEVNTKARTALMDSVGQAVLFYRNGWGTEHYLLVLQENNSSFDVFVLWAPEKGRTSPEAR